MRIGFIGLGIMGRPMAKHLMEAGHTLTVWNRSRPGIDELVEAGADEGASPADVAAKSEVVFSMVGDSPDVEAVSLGEDGIIGGAKPGLVHIDCTTMSPEVTFWPFSTDRIRPGCTVSTVTRPATARLAGRLKTCWTGPVSRSGWNCSPDVPMTQWGGQLSR